MKEILLYPTKKRTGERRVHVSEKLHAVLCVYEVMFPKGTTLHIGSKTLVVGEYTAWPPPEQQGLGLEVEAKKVKRNTDLG